MTDFAFITDDPDFAEAFTVTRRTEVFDEAAESFAVNEETASATGSIQPAAPGDLERLPEEDRGREAVSVWTRAKLSSGGTGDAKPDRITRADGTAFLVVNVETWPHMGQVYYRALALMERPGE